MSIGSHLSRPLLHCFKRLPTQLPKANGVHRNSSTAFVKRNVTLNYAVFSAESSNIDHPPIIVSHGVFGNKKEWEGICKELNAITGRKVVVYDAVNHGASPHHGNMSYYDMAIDLVTLLEKLNINKKISCVGHRMGGKTAMTLALTQPERIEQIVVIDTVPSVRQNDIMGDNTSTVLQQVLNLKLQSYKTREEVVKKLEEMNIFPRLHNAMLTNLMEVEGGLRWTINLDALFNNYNEILSFPSFNEEAFFTGPSLFLAGNASHLSCEGDHPSIMKRFPSAQLHFMAERGDYDFNLHKSKPEDLLYLLKEFLYK